jgi:ribonuclease-3
LGVRIHSLELLNQALMHRSYVYEMEMSRAQSNERMEFLGDAILGLLVNEHLYATYASRQEGRLTKIKSLLVSETVLSRRAEELAFGDYILLSENERLSGGARRSSILADAFEAVIAAIYIDAGLDAARRFVENHILARMDEFLEVDEYRNYKSMIQEHAQKTMGVRPRYRVVSATGPEHERTFYVELRLGGRALGRGEGLNKKVAEQMAARNALRKLKLISENDSSDSRSSAARRRRQRKPLSGKSRPSAEGSAMSPRGRTPSSKAGKPSSDQRASNQRTSDQRASNQRTSNQRTSNQRTSNQRAPDQRARDASDRELRSGGAAPSPDRREPSLSTRRSSSRRRRRRTPRKETP